jgi:multidrug resistance protein, MATE family
LFQFLCIYNLMKLCHDRFHLIEEELPMSHPKALSRYKQASLNELVSISVPLILAQLSGSVMTVVDRLFLSHVSLSAMNAAVTAGITAWVFLSLGMGISGICEVFVGQYYGANHDKKIGRVVWQMIWFSLALSLIYVPIGLGAGDVLLPQSVQAQGVPYFKIMVSCGASFAISSALTAFFAGRGKTRIITYVTIVGNVCNAILDILLIFGYSTYIPAMGTAGAAWATILSTCLQIVIYAVLFLNATSRKRFATNQCRIQVSMMWQCIKMGYPKSIGHVVEIAGWTLMFHWVAAKGNDFLTVVTMGQTLFLMFGFLMDGLSNGVTVIAANILGANSKQYIKRLLYSAGQFHCMVAAVLAVPLIFYPHPLIQAFSFEFDLVGYDHQLAQQLMWAFRYVWLYFVLDGFVWVIAGIFTAAGDTLYIMLCNGLSTWLVGLLPIYLALHYTTIQASTVWLFCDGYAFINLMFFILRYASKRWCAKSVLTEHISATA